MTKVNVHDVQNSTLVAESLKDLWRERLYLVTIAIVLIYPRIELHKNSFLRVAKVGRAFRPLARLERARASVILSMRFLCDCVGH